jgi:hypothetical protein
LGKNERDLRERAHIPDPLVALVYIAEFRRGFHDALNRCFLHTLAAVQNPVDGGG